MIVDAHAHIFSLINGFMGEHRTSDLGYGKVFNGITEIQLMPPLCEKTIHTPEMLIAQMNWAGVEKAVLLQGPFYGECNCYLLEAVRKFPERLIAMAYLDPWEKEAHRYFEDLLETRGFVGIKLECSSATGLMTKHKQARLSDPDLNWLWIKLEKHRLTLTLDLGKPGFPSYQTESIRQIAVHHPKLKIVIAHLAQPGPQMAIQRDLRDLWNEQIDLGLLANVWFDTSAVPHYFPEEQFPFPSTARFIKEVIERIGPDKVLWGTDIPGLLAAASYPQLVSMAKMHTNFLDPQDRTKVLYQNAIKVYENFSN